MDGKWSAWSSWSTCGPDCKQHRKRTCTNPIPSFDGKPCPPGKDIMSMNCTGGLCGLGKKKGQILSEKEKITELGMIYCTFN